MANKLTDIEIDEISLVDKGANAKAKVLLYKRDQGRGRDIISKCLDAVEKGDVSSLEPAHFEQALEQLTRLHMKEDDTLCYHRAYCEALRTEDGSALYNGLNTAVADVVRKRDTGAA
jgi:hypothetical protein